MKRDFLIVLVLLVLATGASVMAACPADTVDTGNCDSLYIEPWPADIADTVFQRPGPYIIRVPIYYTHDVTDPTLDSVTTMVIPLCYTHTYPDKYCSVSTYLNKAAGATMFGDRGIFRHMPSNGDPQVHNWMLDLFDAENGEEWNTIILDLASDTGQYFEYGTVPAHFWLSMLLSSSEDMRFGTGEHTLIATITFKMQDKMNICIDTCFWPPSSRLDFERMDAKRFYPRMGSDHDPLSYKVCFPPRDTSDVKEIEGINDTKPSDFSLSQNYPNPFNPVTNFQFTLPKSSHVKIEIFNIVGQKVAILVDGDMKPGLYTADWNGRDENGKSVSSGIYFYRMQADDFSDMKKMVLVK
jgi:hypothetical protein